MSTTLEIMVFVLAAILIGITLFPKIYHWRYYKPTAIFLLVVYVLFGIWEIFIKKHNDTQDVKNIQTTVKQADTTTNKHIDTSTNSITKNSDQNRDSIIKSIPKAPKQFSSDTKHSVKKYDIHDNKFSGPTQIGDSNKMEVTIEPKPREVTEDILNRVQKDVKDFNSYITIYRTSQDNESVEFATKIIKALNQIGYKNVVMNGISSGAILGLDPESTAKYLQQIHYRWENNVYIITIPSN